MKKIPQGDPRRARALALVAEVRSGNFSDAECAERLEELSRLIPHPAWTDLLFYRTPELTDEGVVGEALAYRAIEL
ncbi:hypothetical protein ACL02U_06375 [Streptomyces sp. MS06]|uniref:hypothetical protein n=1 Tax=Streptomyces sp. MS06 TaxID=3385974 RepID=UPI0039A2FA7A